MKYVKLGNTGVDVSKICLGCMSFGTPGSENGVFPWARTFEDAKPIFKKAVDLGINYFDTANVYQMGSSEEITGKLIREFGLDCDDIVVATKVDMTMRPDRPNGGGLSRKEIMSEIDKSLERLRMDYVDLYQIHRADPNTPFEETMEALHDLVKSGKVRYIRMAISEDAEHRREKRLDEIHHHAEPVQSDVSGRRAGDDSLLSGYKSRHHSLEPSCRRSSDPSVGNGDGTQQNRRRVTHGLGPEPRTGSTRYRKPAKNGSGTRLLHGTDGFGMDAEQAIHHGTHRGDDFAETRGGGCSGARHRSCSRGNRISGGSLYTSRRCR